MTGEIVISCKSGREENTGRRTVRRQMYFAISMVLLQREGKDNSADDVDNDDVDVMK